MIYTKAVAEVRNAYAPYQDHLQEEEKMGYSWRQLPFEGNKGSNLRADLPHREVCRLLGAWIKDITRKPPSLVQPLDYYQYFFSVCVVMKPHHIVQEQSKETLEPWGNW